MHSLICLCAYIAKNTIFTSNVRIGLRHYQMQPRVVIATVVLAAAAAVGLWFLHADAERATEASVSRLSIGANAVTVVYVTAHITLNFTAISGGARQMPRPYLESQDQCALWQSSNYTSARYVRAGPYAAIYDADSGRFVCKAGRASQMLQTSMRAECLAETLVDTTNAIMECPLLPTLVLGYTLDLDPQSPVWTDAEISFSVATPPLATTTRDMCIGHPCPVNNTLVSLLPSSSSASVCVVSPIYGAMCANLSTYHGFSSCIIRVRAVYTLVGTRGTIETVVRRADVYSPSVADLLVCT